MTKKDYIALAAILAEQRAKYTDEIDSTIRFAGRFALAETARSMATLFASQNPRFDRETFLTACGL